MRQLFCIFVALVCSSVVAGPTRWAEMNQSKTIDPKQSAGLFVGVSLFPYDDNLASVPYAVDDAVDLAYELTMERDPVLVDPKRVVLALSGKPQKPESQEKLRKLLAAGVPPAVDAGFSEIMKQIESQSRSVGKGGILFVGFATHGVSEDGTQYLLTSGSSLARIHHDLTDAEVRDIVSRNGVARSIIFIDACRERLRKDRRNGEADPLSKAAFLRDVSRINGQVVFSAATNGGYAYDDEERRNGVFTATIIEGLRCGAQTNASGFVTADTLHSFVEARVLAWLQAHKDPGAKKATQWTSEGNSKDLPLSICASHSAASLRQPAR
ncbi:MAG: hypothetical protein QOE82_3064 [Thermoanaerobaculia bacterium]|nr:hypothetical protein [Thermoanaerobaculia bacterium]